MDNKREEYTFLWFVENYSYCWHKNGEELISPEFTLDKLEGTVWTLSLYPRGETNEHRGHVSVYLNRSEVDEGPEVFKIKYELSVVLANGPALSSAEVERTYKRGKGYGRSKFVKIDEVLLHRKNDFLPGDTLNVRCKIWREGGSVHPVTQIIARTRIGIERMSFLHEIEDFGALQPNEKNTISTRSASKKGLSLTSSLFHSDESCCKGKIMVEIAPSDANRILTKYKYFLLDRSSRLVPCGEADYRFDAAVNKDSKNISLSLTRPVIMNRKSEYLPEGKLTLLCECTFTIGVECEKIESTLHEIPSMAINQLSHIDQDITMCSEKLPECPSALDALKGIYNNQFLTDVEIKTKTKSFSAHKILLCARSSVFTAMMTNNMREKDTDCIEIDDLEDDIVQQFLYFLYSDHIENLHWESATKLYYAADKYEVQKLKTICSSFLLDNLSTSSASELLLLADTHSDSHLKTAVEDFIFKHEGQVYDSDEWGRLMETNSLLVSKTMLLLFKRKA